MAAFLVASFSNDNVDVSSLSHSTLVGLQHPVWSLSVTLRARSAPNSTDFGICGTHAERAYFAMGSNVALRHWFLLSLSERFIKRPFQLRNLSRPGFELCAS